jgi:ubiquinone/menaquinone biosynthesis C-methylase UbiE
MPWWPTRSSPYATARAMIGVKPGDRVLVIGAGNGELAAQLALVTGLNGRTLVVDVAPEAAQHVDRAAARAGALVEFNVAPTAILPLDPATFDIVTVNRPLARIPDRDRSATIAEAVRVLRPGGRVLVLEHAERRGLFGARPPAGPALSGDAVRELLTAAGLRAARVLANAEGRVYVEAIKARV